MATIKVTEDHIKRGSRSSTMCCPVALALKDRSYRQASVGMQSITWRPSPGVVACARTPLNARRFMCDFDADLPVEPFEFNLRESK